ncbi:BnaC04g37310D [Brassica napus]|uniref:BnaC04g37310D protein n=1 Tax=Brassica napus TaxID=3708 RepID=A0A078HH24_BRANA|nr:BnaC04g37310D [Brassica napus]
MYVLHYNNSLQQKTYNNTSCRHLIIKKLLLCIYKGLYRFIFYNDSSVLQLKDTSKLSFGHITAFLHLSNKLAEKGHEIVFLLPKKALDQVKLLNLYPNLITFHTQSRACPQIFKTGSVHTISIPHVKGLPPGAETNFDVPFFLTHLLAVAMNQTRPEEETILRTNKPDLVFYDSTDWIPEIAKPVGAKTVCYNTFSAASIALTLVPAAEREIIDGKEMSAEELAKPPLGYPSSKVVLLVHEAKASYGGDTRALVLSSMGKLLR